MFGIVAVSTGSAELISTPSADLSATSSPQISAVVPTAPISTSSSQENLPIQDDIEKDSDIPEFEDKLSNKVDNSGSYFQGEITIKFNSEATRKQKLSLIKENGFKVKRKLQKTGILIIKTPEGKEKETIDKLNKNPLIEYAELSAAMKATLVGPLGGDGNPNICYPLDKHFCGNRQDYLYKMGAKDGWQVNTGNPNMVIAILDTGVKMDHEDLKDKIWKNPGEIPNNGRDDNLDGYEDDYNGWDFIGNGQYPDNKPDDENGHGTIVAGVAAASTNNTVGISGIDWQAKIMPLRVAYLTGIFNATLAAEAIRYATDHGATVINLSFTGDADIKALRDSIKYANDHQVIVVAAASYYNYNQNCFIGYPAAYTNVIAVSGIAQNQSDVAGCANLNSSYTPIRTSVYAANIFSTTFDYNPDPNIKGYYKSVGAYPATSVATPEVSAIASILRGCYANYYTVRDTFKYGGYDYGSPGYDTKYGWTTAHLWQMLRWACGY